MASHPVFPEPDRIDPQAPPEWPSGPAPSESPFVEPPEIIPDQPDVDFPDSDPYPPAFEPFDGD